MAGVEKDQYDALASMYDSIEELPQSAMYQELVQKALGDCKGSIVLDLGGGTGLHARNAVAKGARVDVVDIAPEMLEVGKNIEAKMGRKDSIRWFFGDITKPLKDLPETEYDIVRSVLIVFNGIDLD